MNAVDTKPLPYEKRLDLDLAWALREGSMHFEKDCAVHRTLGKPKPVAFPDPGEGCLRLEGMNVLDLAKLVELTLASGMTGAGRLKDLADVEQVVRILKLDRSFAERLDPYVRPKFLELVEGVEGMEEILTYCPRARVPRVLAAMGAPSGRGRPATTKPRS